MVGTTNPPYYWLVCLSRRNFEVNRQMGFAVNGFKERYRKLVGRVRPQDRIVFYISGIRKFGGTATVTSSSFLDKTQRIWTEADELWPCRFKERPDFVLDQDDFVDVEKLVPHLSFITERQKKTSWGLAFHQSLRPIAKEDFELIESEIRKASQEGRGETSYMPRST